VHSYILFAVTIGKLKLTTLSKIGTIGFGIQIVNIENKPKLIVLHIEMLP